MIKVERVPVPGVLEKNAGPWLRSLKASATKKQRRVAASRYKHREVKVALVAMFRGKCAYCESKITHVEYGHIEHFRPKALFEDLIFEWNNLLLACGICNGSKYKGQKFPGPSEGGPLLDPTAEDPNSHLEFVFDRLTKLASVYGATTRGQTTVTVLGLNRPELRDYRSRQVARLAALAKLARRDAEAAALLQEAISGAAEYSAFARTLSSG